MTFNIFFSRIAAAVRRCARSAGNVLRAPAPHTRQFGLLVGMGPMNR